MNRVARRHSVDAAHVCVLFFGSCSWAAALLFFCTTRISYRYVPPNERQIKLDDSVQRFLFPIAITLTACWFVVFFIAIPLYDIIVGVCHHQHLAVTAVCTASSIDASRLATESTLAPVLLTRHPGSNGVILRSGCTPSCTIV